MCVMFVLKFYFYAEIVLMTMVATDDNLNDYDDINNNF